MSMLKTRVYSSFGFFYFFSFFKKIPHHIDGEKDHIMNCHLFLRSIGIFLLRFFFLHCNCRCSFSSSWPPVHCVCVCVSPRSFMIVCLFVFNVISREEKKNIFITKKNSYRTHTRTHINTNIIFIYSVFLDQKEKTND